MIDFFELAQKALSDLKTGTNSVLEQLGPAWDRRDFNSYIRDAAKGKPLLDRANLPRTIDIGTIAKWITDLREIADRAGVEKGYRFYFSPTEAKWGRSDLITGDEKSINLSPAYRSPLKTGKFVGDIHTHPLPADRILTSTSDFSEQDVKNFLDDREALFTFVSTPDRTLMLLRLSDTRAVLPEPDSPLHQLLRHDAIIPTIPSAAIAARARAALYASVSGPSATLIRVYPLLQ